MLPLAALQLIPASLLLFIATAPTVTQALDNSWPFGLRPFLTTNSGHESLKRSDGIAITPHTTRVSIAVRKMSGDQGEMFFPEYWQFEAEINSESKLALDRRRPIPRSLGPLEDEPTFKDWVNASLPQPLQAPFSLHTSHQLNSRPLFSRLLRSPRDIFALDTRAFACPGGTSDCSSINRPYSCCAAGLVCQLTTDSGLGDVGCCNPGEVCGEEVSGCPEEDSVCPDSLGGGCCIPGSVCDGVGCVVGTTLTSTIEPTVTESPASSSISSTSSSSTTPDLIPAVPLTSTSTSTATTSTTSTVTASPSHSSSISTTQSTSSPAAAIRPTSSADPTTTTTASAVTVTTSQCPTGYFQCSAYYHAGCCQVGRDCSLTSCPLPSSTLAVNSDGVTVAVPSGTGGAAVGLGASGCAQGWFSCASGQGGGCCPSGYACGTSCTATGVVVQGGATGTAKVAKDNGAERADVRSWVAIGLLGLVALIVS